MRLYWMAYAFCTLLAASCASPPSRFPPVTPGQLFPGGYINLRAPNSEGWRLVKSSPQGMAFGKEGIAAGENISAQLVMFGLQPTDTPEQFVDVIKKGIESDTNPDRFETLESSVKYTNERGYPCVRHHALVTDRAAQTSPTTKEQLLLETYSLYCRHPIRTNTGFAAIYSYRGRQRFPDLERGAQDFIEGAQVPPGRS